MLVLLAGGLAPAAAQAPRVNTEAGNFPLRVLPAPTKEELKRGAEVAKLPSNLKIPPEWVPYLNRATEEFWTEGNHRPDAGFVLLARNPSKETAKLWLLRMEAKARALTEMYGFVAEAQKELVRGGFMADRFPTSVARQGALPGKEAPKTQGSVTDKDLKELQFYFLFSPSCGHCAELAETLIPFPNVVPLQVTEGPLKNFPGLPKSTYATKETKEAYLKEGVTPVVVVSWPKKNIVTTLTGNHSTEDLLLAAATVVSTSSPKK